MNFTESTQRKWRFDVQEIDVAHRFLTDVHQNSNSMCDHERV